MNDNEAHEVIAWRLERDLDGRPGWAHPSLMAQLDGLTVEQASWRAGAGKRCIRDYVRHMVMWRAHVAARLEGEALEEPDDEWPQAGEGSEAEWAADLEALRSTTARIAAALRAMQVETRHPHDAGRPAWISVLGVLQHDSYHLGQIAMLRGLQGLAAVE